MEKESAQNKTVPANSALVSDSIDIPALFADLFKLNAFIEVFETRFARSSSKGVDRLNGFQFSARAGTALATTSRKCTEGSHRFSPYLENLKSKGRNRAPRLISIPTIRDRVVLHQLNKLIAAAFPECVPKNVANSYIRSIIDDLKERSTRSTYVCGCDIKTFYDSIHRDRLFSILQKRLKFEPAMKLIKRAVLTPTVPKNVRRQNYSSYKSKKGIPQGLAISNILAAIYLSDVDAAMKEMKVTYFRYVDDIFFYGKEKNVRNAHRSLVARLRRRSLSVHALGEGKSHLGPLSSPFGYLGYFFRWPNITVREATVERLLQSIASKFSEYIHNKTRRLEKFNYLNEERLAEIFLLELNERISGAISEKRRYGWIAYFSQINDLSLLHKLDDAVSQMFRRMTDFDRKAPDGLKKFRRAYFEMKFNPSGGYVRDYDKIVTRTEKLTFLLERGRVSPTDTLTDDQINARFDSYRRRVLSQMHADEQAMY